MQDQENKKSVLAGQKLQDILGCQVSWPEPDEIVSRLPIFDTTQIAGGDFGELDSTMDPNAVLMGYKYKAVALGAKFVEAEVESMLTSGNLVNGM